MSTTSFRARPAPPSWLVLVAGQRYVVAAASGLDTYAELDDAWDLADPVTDEQDAVFRSALAARASEATSC